MITTITRIGNSGEIIIDTAIMDFAHLKVGDEVDVTVHEDGRLMLSPIRDNTPKPAEVEALIRKTAFDYANTLQRLS